MAQEIKKLNGRIFGASGFSGITHTGLAQVTDVSLKKEFTINVEAVNSAGDTTGVLMAGEKNTASVSGYASVYDAPKIGEEMTVGVGGVPVVDVTKATIRATNQDFVKIQLEGEYYPALAN